MFHNYRDRRNPKSSINIQCSVCKYQKFLNFFKVDFLAMCTNCTPRNCARERRSATMDPVLVEIEKMLFVQDDNSFVPIEDEKIIEQVDIENGPLITIDETEIFELDQELTLVK